MRRRLLFVAVLATLGVAACGSGEPPEHHTPSHAPPESARRPEGFKPQTPPVSVPPFSANPRHISVRGLHLIEGFEGFSSCPYWDPYGSVWTRGYGETEGITGSSSCISQAQGEGRLRYLVEARYEWALRALRVPLNQNQWDALCSFVWNLGAGIFEGTSVGADLRARAYRAAAANMLAYDHAGGVVLEGLRIRREVEVRLFLTPDTPSACERHRTICRHLIARRHELHAITAHMRRSHCLVKHPRRACGGLYRHRSEVRKLIRRLERQLH